MGIMAPEEKLATIRVTGALVPVKFLSLNILTLTEKKRCMVSRNGMAGQAPPNLSFMIGGGGGGKVQAQ